MLRLWLPFNGDLHNQGLSDYEITTLGTISWVNGKIGKALSAGSASQTVNGVSINSNLTDILSEDYSVAVWVKPLGNHVHYNGTILSSGNWNNTRWAFGLSQNNTKVDVLSNGYNVFLDCPIPVNEWTHLCCVRTSDGLVSLYKNGEYVNSLYRDDHPLSDANNTTVGRETYANGYFSFNGNINDLRLYDHALSPKEIKELSKGLVLHYPLNRGGFGQDNISANSGDLTKWNKESGITCTWDSDKQMYKIQSTSTSSRWGIWQQVSCESNTTYTFSVDGMKTDQNMYLSVGSMAAGAWPSNRGAFTTERKRLSYTWTTGSDHTVIRMYLAIYPTADGSKTGYYALPKLEFGSTSTPWIPNSADTLYSAMGLNSNVEYDVSGYINNGTITGELTCTSDTPRYNVSTHISATNQKIHISNFPTSGFGDSYSFAWWGKRSSNSPMFWGFSDGIRLNGMYLGTLWNTGDGSNNPLYKIGTTTQVTAPSTGVWHHYVMTGNGTKCYVYLDGELWAEAKTYKSISGTSIYINGWDSGTSYCSSNMSISDFRIYATALSADDVLELYHTPVSIANNGVLMTQGEISEV